MSTVTTYLVKRILLMFVTLFGICLVSFVVINLAPGDPADKTSGPGGAGESQAVSDLVIRKNRERMFLDKPIVFNPSPTDRDSKNAVMINDLLSDDVYVVRDVMEKGRLADLGTVAIPYLVNAAQRPEIDERSQRVLLKALSKVTAHWGKPPTGTASGSQAQRIAAWDNFWKANAQRFSEPQAKKVVATYFAAPESARAAALTAIKELGHVTLPALMDQYRSGNGQAEVLAARALSFVGRKPWDLTTDEKEKAGYVRDWDNLRRELKERRLVLEKSLTKANPKAQRRARGRIGVVEKQLAELGSSEDFIRLKERSEFSDHRRGWRNWWERREEAYVRFGTSKTLLRMFTDTRFGHWFGKLLVLDFGESYTTNRPVLEMIKERFGVTFKMNIVSIFLTYLIAIPIGIFSSTHQYSLADRVTTVLLFVLYSLPSFWVGTMMIWLLTGPPYLDWFPAMHAHSADWQSMTTWEQFWDSAHHLALPIICLSYGGVAYISRQMRAGMLETIRQDFIRTARAKGLSEPVVVFKHALRNSLIPIVTLLANLLPLMIGGSVIIEQIFSIEGLGKLSFEAVLNRDYPLIMAIFTFSGFLTLVGILVSDVTYALVDPRIKYS